MNRDFSYQTVAAVAASIVFFSVIVMGEARKGHGHESTHGRQQMRERQDAVDCDGKGNSQHLETGGNQIDAGGSDPGAGSVAGQGVCGEVVSPDAGRDAGVVRNDGRRMRANVTAYCPCKKCCGAYADGITASGKPVTANGGHFVAADPSLPFAALVRIPGYAGGKAVPVLDRGGAIKGNRIDVFFPTHREALEWGRQTLTVEIER